MKKVDWQGIWWFWRWKLQHPIILWTSLYFFASLMGLTYLSFYILPVIDIPNTLAYIGVYLGLTIIAFVGAYLGRNLPWSKGLFGLLAAGIMYRAILIPLAPAMSDDIYRYLWDGKIQNQGINPYALPPNHPYLASYRDTTIHPFINHPKYRTVYPALGQFFFAGAAWLHPNGFLGLKAFLFLAELSTLLLLGFWLRKKGLPLGRLLFYAWCPLPILETMLDGHLDAFALPFLVGAVLALRAYRPWLTGALMAMSVLIKPLGLFICPMLFWRFRWKNSIRLVLGFLLTCIVLYIPYYQAGRLLFEQLLYYSRHWYFNGPVFSLLDIWFIPVATRSFLAACIIAASLTIPFLRRFSVETRFLFPLATYMLMTPTLYPWYIVWLAPWLVLRPSPWLIYWMLASPLAHGVHEYYAMTGRWTLPPWLMVIEFVPLFALLILDLAKPSN